MVPQDLIEELKERKVDLEKMKELVNQIQMSEIIGIQKLKNKITADYDFVLRLLKDPEKIRADNVSCRNTGHLNGILQKCSETETQVLAVFRNMVDVMSGDKLCVEIVAKQGHVWIKVICQDPRSLHYRWCCESEPHILTQAAQYLNMAKVNQIMFNTPTVVFEFICGVPEPVYQKLTQMGIQVNGNIVHVDELPCVSHNDFYDSDSDDDSSNQSLDVDRTETQVAPPIGQARNEGFCKKLYNLDLTALFAYLSNMTNGYANYEFKTKLLNEQAAEERAQPVLSTLQELFKDADIMICESAHSSFMTILDTVGGENERKRAEKFLAKIEIKPDRISERAALVKTSFKHVKERSKIVFGAGDFYEAITVTANKHFVAAASQQGINFAVVIHGARALSEQKQLQPLE